jgi:hypothetical protein
MSTSTRPSLIPPSHGSDQIAFIQQIGVVGTILVCLAAILALAPSTFGFQTDVVSFVPAIWIIGVLAQVLAGAWALKEKLSPPTPRD